MSVMSDIDLQIQEAMQEASRFDPGSPEQLFEERIDRLYEECDKLMVLASDPEQWPLFKQERMPLLQTLLRLQAICWKLTGDDIEPLQRLIVAAETLRKAPVGLRMVRNA